MKNENIIKELEIILNIEISPDQAEKIIEALNVTLEAARPNKPVAAERSSVVAYRRASGAPLLDSKVNSPG